MRNGNELTDKAEGNLLQWHMACITVSHTIGFDPPHWHPGVLHFVNCRRGMNTYICHILKNFNNITLSYGKIGPGDGKLCFFFSYITKRRRAMRRRRSIVSPPDSHIKVRHFFSLGLVFTCIWVPDITRKTKLSPSKAGPRKWPFDVFTFGVRCGMWVLPPLTWLSCWWGSVLIRQLPWGNELPWRALADTIPFSEDRTIDARPLIFFTKNKKTRNKAVMKRICIKTYWRNFLSY